MENITIRPNMKIGQLDAENDTKFLSECYVDNLCTRQKTKKLTKDKA